MKSNVLSPEMKDRLAEVKKARDEAPRVLDETVLEARAGGATLREISEATGMSIPWVQQALVRADPNQERYTKRRRTLRD